MALIWLTEDYGCNPFYIKSISLNDRAYIEEGTGTPKIRYDLIITYNDNYTYVAGFEDKVDREDMIDDITDKIYDIFNGG